MADASWQIESEHDRRVVHGADAISTSASAIESILLRANPHSAICNGSPSL
jgi:hypothetical protein